MPTINITGTITDSSGATANFSTTANTDAVSIVSATVSPDPAPPGTTRTLTVVATSAANLVMTATVTSDDASVAFTPVAGQPAGTFAWTFVF